MELIGKLCIDATKLQRFLKKSRKSCSVKRDPENKLNCQRTMLYPCTMLETMLSLKHLEAQKEKRMTIFLLMKVHLKKVKLVKCGTCQCLKN